MKKLSERSVFVSFGVLLLIGGASLVSGCLVSFDQGAIAGDSGSAGSDASTDAITTLQESGAAPDGAEPFDSAPRPFDGSPLPLWIADSEVEEMSIFAGVNLFGVTAAGVLDAVGSTTPFSSEPTGLAYVAASGHFFVSDDNKDAIFKVDPVVLAKGACRAGLRSVERQTRRDEPLHRESPRRQQHRSAGKRRTGTRDKAAVAGDGLLARSTVGGSPRTSKSERLAL